MGCLRDIRGADILEAFTSPDRSRKSEEEIGVTIVAVTSVRVTGSKVVLCW